MCWKTGRLNTDTKDELWLHIPELKASGLFDHGARWFFRFSKNSPKDGCPSFPVLSEFDVLEKISTSGRALFALENGEDTLYFRKFDDSIHIQNEFRVFVYSGNITAISTYTTDFTNFTLMADSVLRRVATHICEFHRDIVARFSMTTASYTMDVHVSDALAVSLIEFNSFGYASPAGACCFDWVDDFAVLYGDGSCIEFRLAELE